MTFGQKMAFCRKEKKLSQAEPGKLSSINGDIIGKYERDEMKPSIETAKKLADALSVHIPERLTPPFRRFDPPVDNLRSLAWLR